MKRAFPLFFLAALLLSGCPPHRTATPSPDEPHRDRRLYVRVTGDADALGALVETGDDGKRDGRFDGRRLLVDPKNAESLACGGSARPLDVVVMIAAEAADVEALRRVVERCGVEQVVGVPRSSLPEALQSLAPRHEGAFDAARISYGPKLPGRIDLGSELSVRVLSAKAGEPASGIRVRFVDMTFLIVGAATPEVDDATVLIPLRGAHPEVHAEVSFGVKPPAGAYAHHGEVETSLVPAPGSGKISEISTEGSEARFSAGMFRDRHGGYVRCPGEGPCRTEVEVVDAGPLLARLEIPEGHPGWFLVETRAMGSYLTEERLAEATGEQRVEVHGHSHGSGGAGVPVPAFHLGGIELSGIRAQPVEPVQVGDRRVEGVIGRNVLASFDVTVAPSAGRLTLELALDQPRADRLPEPQRSESGARIPMDWSPKGPLVLARAGERRHSLFVSTGVAISLVRAEAAESEVELETPFLRLDDDADPVWVTGLQVHPLEVSVLDVGGVAFEDVKLHTPVTPEQSEVLGADFLGQFQSVTFRFRARELRLSF